MMSMATESIETIKCDETAEEGSGLSPHVSPTPGNPLTPSDLLTPGNPLTPSDLLTPSNPLNPGNPLTPSDLLILSNPLTQSDPSTSSDPFNQDPRTSSVPDSYQGPHNWRKSLKPVQSPVKEQLPDFSLDETAGRLDQPDSGKVEKAAQKVEKLKEKVKNFAPKKESNGHGKPRNPTVAKVSSSAGPHQGLHGNVSPLFTKRRPGVPGTREGGLLESTFTRQVVNKPASPSVPHRRLSASSTNTRIPVPTVSTDKKLSPGIIRKTSFNTNDNGLQNCEAWIKRLEKVRKARLYLLGQMGPNSFSIGGDSPDHKYKVIIGPQKCNCGKGPHCVHVLFVMLRVFQVAENDSQLWSRTLKNFEVETLFRNFHARRTIRLDKDPLKRKRRSLRNLTKSSDSLLQPQEESMSSADTESTRNSDSEDENEELVKEEEDTCPICLLEMVEGESLMECSSGCQNKLHHHCISIWFNECRRHNEPLICPLCRAAWKEDFIGDAPMVSVNGEASVDDQLDVPPNTRASSPHGSESDPDMMLPYADPIPPEHAETARLWIPVLGEEITSCLFSKNWAVREASLKHVSRLAQGALLLGVGAGRARVVLSSTRQAATRKMLECCCNVLAFMCADPVYKVFVAGLRTLRTVLSYTPCRDENQQTRLQRCMKSVVNTILWKCADSNKRTSQLSISALQELVKGQDGELGVGREIANPGTFDLGGVCYLLSCICQSFEVTSVQWQWLLGRFYMLDVLLDGNVSEFIIRPQEDGNYENYDRVFTILRFCVPAMNYGHQKVDRMARRVFYLLSKLQVQSTSIFKEIVDEILDDTNIHVQVYMRRKLLKVLSESQDGKEADGSPFITPIVSAASTPRCNSPVAASPPPPSWIPEAPPNTPNYKRMKSSHSAQTLAFSDLDAASALGLNVPCDASTPDASRMHKHSSMVVQVSDACTSPTLCIRGLPSPTESSDDSHPLARVSSQQDVGSQTESVAIRPSQLFGFTDESLYSEDKGVQTPDSLSEVGDELDIPIPGPDDDDFQPCASGNATYNTSASAFLTEDLSDLTLSPSGPEDKVSFKTEVASSPQTSAGSSQENCHCKEEIEKEEAEALAEALAKSTLKQDALPHVPGLSQTESQQETLTIRIHEEGGDQPHQYQELVHWVLGPMLGTGAFSTCYQARDIKTGTLMAVKQISFCRNSLSEQEKVIEAVHEEIEMMARLNHPNVVRILGATQQGFHFFMFVEWMPGGSVALLLDKYGPFTEQVMINYTLQVLRGLAYLHDNHMLHRDLKGANLLVDSTGQRVRIGDFGASARLASRNTGAGEFQGQLLGTIAFMAPEVLRGESYGRSCDVWGIGCIVIEMATTKPPWGASDISNHLALIFKIASAERAPSIPECLSPPLRDLALRCLDPNREERPPARDLLKHPVFTMSR